MSFLYISCATKKEYAFLDHEVDLRLYSKKSQKQQNQPEPTTDDEDDDHDQGKNRNDDLIKHGGGGGAERKFGVSLRRNFSVSAAPTYQKNGGIERQNSTRSIQGAVKRAFSLSLGRSSSVNSERYCRIYDQSSTLEDDDDDDDFEMRNDDDDDESNNGSVETRSVGQKKKKKKEQQNNGKKQNVGSRVLRACKRLFSR